MERWLGLILLFFVFLAVVTTGSAQDQSDAAANVNNLNAQLIELQHREAELKIQLEQLKFDLKPENIERYFSGHGSTRPEELREMRRRQLGTSRDLVTNELEQLASSRSNLEAAISNAEIHRQSSMVTSALQRDRTSRLLTFPRVLALGALLTVALGSVVLRQLIIDRTR
jgi:cell division protein FtsB